MPNLTVPHRRQLDFGYCLPACIEMVLAYYGISRSQAEIATQLGLVKGVGAPASRVMRLASRSLRVAHHKGDWPDLVAALESGVPPIVGVRTNQLPYWSEDTFHVVLLTGT